MGPYNVELPFVAVRIQQLANRSAAEGGRAGRGVQALLGRIGGGAEAGGGGSGTFDRLPARASLGGAGSLFGTGLPAGLSGNARVDAAVMRYRLGGRIDSEQMDGVLQALGAMGGIGSGERLALRPLLRDPAVTAPAREGLRSFLDGFGFGRHARW